MNRFDRANIVIIKISVISGWMSVSLAKYSEKDTTNNESASCFYFYNQDNCPIKSIHYNKNYVVFPDKIYKNYIFFPKIYLPTLVIFMIDTTKTQHQVVKLVTVTQNG